MSGGLVAALYAPVVQFGVGGFGFAVAQLAGAWAVWRFLLQAGLRMAGD